MVGLVERVVARHLEARSTPFVTSPDIVHKGQQIRKVLKELDKSKIFLSFDILSGLLQETSRLRHLPDEEVQTAKILAGQFKGITQYLRGFATDALAEASDLSRRMEQGMGYR